MPKYLLTNAQLKQDWSGGVPYGDWRGTACVTNPSYSEDLSTKAKVGKSAICTYFVFNPYRTNDVAGDFPTITYAKALFLLNSEVVLENLIGASVIKLDNVTYNRCGQRVTISNKRIVAVMAYIEPVGVVSPSFIVRARIRRVSNDEVLAEANGFTRAQLGSGARWVTFTFTPTVINEEVRVCIEIEGGTASEYANVYYHTVDVISGVFSKFTTVWTDESANDLRLTLVACEPLTGNFASGTWTFKVRLESDTKYGFSVKVAIRLSKGATIDGANATLITVSESPNVLAIPASAGGSVSDSWTWSADAVALSNEYLFAEYRIHIEVAGTSTACQCSFAVDENPATADESIDTPTFTAGAILKEVTDAFGLTDTVLRHKTLIISDSFGMLDTPLRDKAFIMSDSFGMTDTVLRDKVLVLQDSFGLSDIIELMKLKVVLDEFGLTDIAYRNKQFTITDSMGLTDTILRDKTLVLSDSLGLTDIVRTDKTLVISDSFGLTDVIELLKLILVSDAFGLTDVIELLKFKTVSDAFGLTDVPYIDKTLTIQDSFGTLDVVQTHKTLILSDSFGVTDIIEMFKLKEVLDQFGLTDTVEVSRLMAVTDVIGMTDVPLINKVLEVADVIGMFDTVLSDKVIILTDSFGLTEVVTVYVLAPPKVYKFHLPFTRLFMRPTEWTLIKRNFGIISLRRPHRPFLPQRPAEGVEG